MYFFSSFFFYRIVETMSYTDKVANFLEAPTNELDTVNMEDLELVAGDVIERVKSQPNSPLGKIYLSYLYFKKLDVTHVFINQILFYHCIFLIF